jgi:RHS repeat-associated protein
MDGWSLSCIRKDQTTSITRARRQRSDPADLTGHDQTERTQAGPSTFVTSALGVSSSTSSSGSGFYTRDAGGNLVSLRSASGRFYYLFDGLGSVVGLVNTSGAKVNSYSYDPYGVQLSASETVPNPWRYAAGYFDTQTGLTKFGTRYYDPTLARFTQRDPSGKDLPYAYAGCNPVNNTDPSGALFSCTIGAITLAVVGLWLGVVATGGLVALGVTAAEVSAVGGGVSLGFTFFSVVGSVLRDE